MKRFKLSAVSFIFSRLLFLLACQQMLFAATSGTEFSVSIEEYQLFPAGEDNAILGFGWLRSGFGFADETTTCTFGSVFPVSGHLSLSGGTLTLTSDLLLQNYITFASGGHIKGQNHMFSLAESVTALPSSHPVILENVALYLNHDLRITHTVTIRGTCSIYGGDNNIVLGSLGNIVVDHDSSLLLSSIELHGARNHNVRCLDDSGQFIFDHVRFVQTSNYSFTQGSILFRDTTQFVGPYSFNYASSLTSTIDVDSMFFISDLARLTLGDQDGRSPLYFEDQTSVLKIENAALNVVNDGLTLIKGTFLGGREVSLEVDSTSTVDGLFFGNGNAADDLYLKMLPGSALRLISGHVTYNIVSASNFFNEQTNVLFERGAGTTFYIAQDVIFQNIHSSVSGLPVFTLVEPGVDLYHINSQFDFPAVSYSLTGTKFASGLLDVLESDDYVDVHSGTYPFGLNVTGRNNKLLGTGSINGPITLTNSAASLALFFDGPILQDITLAGGLLIADRSCEFGNNAIIKGSGQVNLGRNELLFGPKDLSYTGSISWTGDEATIILRSNIELSSEWTFTGNTHINLNWNLAGFNPTGKVVVGSNSTLHIYNGYITNLDSERFHCIDHTSRIVLDNVYASLAADFTFSIGTMQIRNVVSLSGSHTFNYSSVNTSTILSNATLNVGDGMTFIAGRTSSPDGREPLYFEDSSSIISFDDATLVVTSSGTRFTRGKAVVNKQLVVDVNSTSTQTGVIFGDLTEENDFIFRINPGATFYLPAGHISYENVSPLGIQAVTTLANAVTTPETQIFLASDVILKDLTVFFAGGLAAYFNEGVNFFYDNCTFVAPGIQFKATAKRFNDFANILETNHTIYVETGDLPLGTVVSGPNNAILGFGGIVQPVVLVSPFAVLSLGIDSNLLSTVTLGNGIVNIVKNLTFGDNSGFLGQGIVNLASNSVEFGGLSQVATASIDFISNRGAINLRSNLYLTSRWTVSGDCTINGDGNSFIFGPTGQLVIHPNSTVSFKDVKLDALRDGQFFCLDNSSKLVFDAAILSLDSDISFTLGSFKIINSSSIEGADVQFIYESTQTSSISSRSQLKMKADTTFYYAPQSDRRDLIYFADETSRLRLINATLHSTETGIQLTRGYLEIFGQCRFDSDAFYPAEGIILGDGTVEENDLKLDIYPESVIEVVSGHVVHRNVV